MAAEKRLDELVQSVTLYTNSHVLFHGYVLPFLVLYVSWLYGWVTWYNLWEFYEGGLIGIAVIGCVQILVALFCHWSVHVNSFLTCRKEPDISKATVAKVVPTPNNGSAELVKLNLDDDGTYWFMFQKTKYIWQKEEKIFSGLSFPVNKKLSEYMDWRGYKDDGDIDTAERLYGKNLLEMEIPGFAELFRERATAPFFVFQVFCVALWCLDKYWYYSIFTLIMLVLFECTLVQQQMRNMSEIRKMGNRPFTVQVYRGRRWRPLSTDKLIPGDLVSLSAARSSDAGSGGLVPCDVVLLRGGPCVVDESMLTGESVPQPKESLETRCCSDNPQEMAARLDAEGPEDGRLHVLFGGTRLVQHAAPAKGSALRPPDNGCVVYVLRTGFSTSQGRLLRTILYGVKRVTANNRETFGFILFLLVFAIAAASYVWQKGIEDPTRNRYRLFLECTLILTSVVPPELPIELSLAVNTSLVALSKLGVYCTEPFRIPFAGKVDVCCFDKTGTLTSGELVVEGVALLTDKNKPAHVTPASDVPVETAQVLASCHSLARLSEGGSEDGLAGDPLEKVTLNAVGWNLTRSDAVVPKRGRAAAMKIFHRHHFTSALRRMCVVAGYSSQNTGGETEYVATVKGAPETLASMFDNLPPHYEIAYMQLARRGARVLALGRKKLGRLGARDALKIPREQLESGLEFVGLLVISCPLKNDSRAAVREILHASHRVVMITGDGPLTACHVAKQLDIAHRPQILLSTRESDHWVWRSVDETIQFDLTAPDVVSGKNYDLCVTGDCWDEISNVSKDIAKVLLQRACVYARFAPKQKEQILVGLKSLGKTTLMCGDGTNDVGALKHADVGVAILSGSGSVLEEDTTPTEKIENVRAPARLNQDGFLMHQRNREPAAARQLRVLVQELEEQDRARVVRPGDASIASPFTSKLSSVLCICHVIKQGRCTLVTTLQMFKILALNALILAYSQSVLYLDGIRLRDGQATLQGLLLAACFLFVSRSRPLKTLSERRPLPNIFNAYTILTVLLQFAVHFGCLVYVVREAKVRTPPEELAAVAASAALSEDEQDEMFRPNILNSAVYVTSLALQVTTFAVNYRGTPFMESLMQNRLLLYSVLGSGLSVLVLVMGWLPDLATHFELIEFAPDFRSVLLSVLIADVVLSYVVDRACLWLFGEGRHRRD